MLLEIKNFFTKKYNITLILIVSVVSGYSVFSQHQPTQVLNLFLLALVFLTVGIHPYINKKDMYLMGNSYPFSGGKLDYWLRLILFILSIYGYFAVLYKMVKS